MSALLAEMYSARSAGSPAQVVQKLVNHHKIATFSIWVRIYGNFSKLPNFRGTFLFLVSAKLLNIYSVLHLKALQYRWLVKLLTTTQLLYNTCLLELSLEPPSFTGTIIICFAFNYLC